jgi:hypothetical protein
MIATVLKPWGSLKELYQAIILKLNIQFKFVIKSSNSEADNQGFDIIEFSGLFKSKCRDNK